MTKKRKGYYKDITSKKKTCNSAGMRHSAALMFRIAQGTERVARPVAHAVLVKSQLNDKVSSLTIILKLL